MKRYIKVLLFCVCFVTAERFAHRRTQGFHICKVYSNLPYAKERDLFNSEEDTAKALQLMQQRFIFLDSGGQCYALLSEDGSTILKLFKQHHMNPEHWIQKIPLPEKLAKLRCQLYRDPPKRRKTFFESCVIAHQELKEESGLIFTHLIKTNNLHQMITVVDLLNIEHQIPADKIEFVLQKKGTTTLHYFESLFEKGHNEQVKEGIDSLISLIKTKLSKQIFDHDPVIKTNVAFVDGHAIEIDVGSFSKEGGMVNLETELMELSKLKGWLENRDPALADYLENKMTTLTSY